jgi:hypothetical protein
MPAQTPNVFTFPRQEPGTQGHAHLVEPLRSLPRLLAEELAGITEAQATRRPAPDAWCIKELVGHLLDAVEINHKRLYMMSTQTDPVLDGWDADARVRERGYAARDLKGIIAEIRAIRAETTQLLTTLVNWNWARPGQHPTRGRESIRQRVEDMVEHEGGHVEEIRRLVAVSR